MLANSDEELITQLWDDHQQTFNKLIKQAEKIKLVLAKQNHPRAKLNRQKLETWQALSAKLIQKWQKQKSKLTTEINRLGLTSNYGQIKNLKHPSLNNARHGSLRPG